MCALQNEAQAYANKVVPQAQGQAAQILEAANAYREQDGRRSTRSG